MLEIFVFMVVLLATMTILLGVNSFVLMCLWNWLIPTAFDGAHPISYYQAFVLCVVFGVYYLSSSSSSK